MKIPVIAGHLFGSVDPGIDSAHLVREVVVSAAFARRYWTPQAAVGKHIKMNAGDEWSTIVGVVGDVRDEGLTQPPAEFVYSPLITMAATGRLWTPRDVAFVVRASDERARSAVSVESAVRQAAPGIPVYRMIPLSTLQSNASARTRFMLSMLAASALLALLIGAVGLYGVTAYLVGLRTREIGVRMALGAQPSDVRRLVLTRAFRDAAVGVVLGIIGAVLCGRMIAALLYGVSPVDPPALAGASALLLATTQHATWLPAKRATQQEPAATKRAEKGEVLE